MTTPATPSGKGSRRTRRRLIIGIVGVGLAAAAAATVGWYVSTGPRDTGVAAVRTDDLSTVGRCSSTSAGRCSTFSSPTSRAW